MFLMGRIARKKLNPSMSEVDLAHSILKGKGKPLYYRELIGEVLQIKPIPGKDEGHIMAGVHTELNMDHRFIHMGSGVWGLREWMPGKRLILNQVEEDYDL